MQIQNPQPLIHLFSGLIGYVGDFVLIDKAYYLPKPNSRFEDEALIALDFFGLTKREVINTGSRDNITLRNPVILDTVPYLQSDYDEPFPDFPIFDGVACFRGHFDHVRN